MFYVSEIYSTKPNQFKTKLQAKVYDVLENLSIPYQRVDTDEAITVDDCVEINKKLNMKMVKTLFLCNRQKTNFYLYIIPGEKKFDSKKFSEALNIPRVSFAPSEYMAKKLGTKIGSTTIFSVLIDLEKQIQIIIDKDILKEEYYGCSDATTTGYMKIKTNDILNKLLPFSEHREIIIEM